MSKTTHPAVYHLGQFASVILSIVFVILLIATSVASATVAAIRPDNLSELLSSIAAEEDENDSIVAVLKSDFMTDIIDLTFAKGGDLTGSDIRSLADEHMNNIIEIYKEDAGEAANKSNAELREELREAVAEESNDIADALNEMTDDMPSELSFILRYKNLILAGLYGAVALIGAAIFFCLYGRARGLRCLGIDALIACVPLFIIPPVVNMLIEDSTPPAVITLLETMLTGITISAIVLAIVGVLLIAGFITYNIRLKKKNNSATPAPQVPVDTI